MHARYVAYTCYRCYGIKTGNFRSVFIFNELSPTLPERFYANVLIPLNVTERELLYEGYCSTSFMHYIIVLVLDGNITVHAVRVLKSLISPPPSGSPGET